MKRLFKVTSLILIQAFLVLDFAWCGAGEVFANTSKQERATLAPQVQFTKESLQNVFLKISSQREGTKITRGKETIEVKVEPVLISGKTVLSIDKGFPNESRSELRKLAENVSKGFNADEFREEMGLIVGVVKGNDFTILRLVPITDFEQGTTRDFIIPSRKQIIEIINTQLVEGEKILGTYHNHSHERLLSNQRPGASKEDVGRGDLDIPDYEQYIADDRLVLVIEPEVNLEGMSIEQVSVYRPTDANVLLYGYISRKGKGNKLENIGTISVNQVLQSLPQTTAKSDKETAIGNIKQRLSAKEDISIFFADMRKVYWRNGTFHSKIVDKEIPRVVKIIKDTMARKYGEAFRWQGDEIGGMIPGHLNQEKRKNLLEMAWANINEEFAGKYSFAKLNDIKPEYKAEILKIIGRYLSVEDDDLPGIYEEDDGVFILFKNKGKPLKEAFTSLLNQINRELLANSLGFVSGAAEQMPLPVVSFGMVRMSEIMPYIQREISVDELFGRAVREAEFIHNLANENNLRLSIATPEDILKTKEMEEEYSNFREYTESPQLVLGEEGDKIIQRYAETGLTVYRDYLDEPHPIFKRGQLGDIIRQALRLGKDLELLEVSPYWLPKSEKMRQGIISWQPDTAQGKENLRWNELMSAYGFKLKNTLYGDHNKATESLKNQFTIVDRVAVSGLSGIIFVVRSKADSFFILRITGKNEARLSSLQLKTFLDKLKEEINKADEDFEVKFSAAYVSKERNDNSEELINSAGNLSRVYDSARREISGSGNLLKLFPEESSSMREQFTNELARTREEKRKETGGKLGSWMLEHGYIDKIEKVEYNSRSWLVEQAI